MYIGFFHFALLHFLKEVNTKVNGLVQETTSVLCSAEDAFEDFKGIFATFEQAIKAKESLKKYVHNPSITRDCKGYCRKIKTMFVPFLKKLGDWAKEAETTNLAADYHDRTPFRVIYEPEIKGLRELFDDLNATCLELEQTYFET
ncbi:MAG: hypothetical protein QM796_20595 [Chthoniobacteraceae bacterium]